MSTMFGTSFSAWRVTLWVFFALVLCGTYPRCALAASRHEQGGGHDDTLIQASNGWQWVGHQQSEQMFITCAGTPIIIAPRDKVGHAGSCRSQHANEHLGVQRAMNTYYTFEGGGEVTLATVNVLSRYALATWNWRGKAGRSVLVTDGSVWHVLSSGVGAFNDREALARGIPREILATLKANMEK